MSRLLCAHILGIVGLMAIASSAQGQKTPYIGFVYPAGGQQGTTVQVRLGGQRIDNPSGALISGQGVSAKLIHYYRKLSNQEVTLLREQLRELRQKAAKDAKTGADDEKTQEMIVRIEKRIAGWCNRPACASLSSIAVVEVSIAPDAKPGAREIRLISQQGVTNPLVFHVAQVPEVARKPMRITPVSVLGKEHLAERKRSQDEIEEQITVPCTMNGQVAAGEVNRYRFQASKGQRLVICVHARELVPYIADAVPGWFQPVITIHNADGKEVAFNDDFRFNPDPTLYFQVPQDGQYVLTINDAIYRGREDFVYRITIGEMPFITSIFPLGGRVGEAANIEINGWNLQDAVLDSPPKDAGPGVYQLSAAAGGLVSNTLPFMLDILPECLDKEPNNDASKAQKVALPIIVNGRVDRSADWDVFQFDGSAGDMVVAEVYARRLKSPLDSMLKVTDADGKLVALNDDHDDPGSGLDTHHADSYVMFKLPADGSYYVHLGDTTRRGGEEYGYRLRISPPRPDFALRVVPSGGGMRSKSGVSASVYAIRKDGFEGPLKLGLKDPPEGFVPFNITLPNDKDSVRIWPKTTLVKTQQPVHLVIEGRAMIDGQEITREAVPAEDRMQAFLWRHLVPVADDLTVLVYDPTYQPPPKRELPPPPEENDTAPPDKPATALKFSKKQVAGRLRQLKALYQEWLLTEDFYNRKVAECEAVE